MAKADRKRELPEFRLFRLRRFAVLFLALSVIASLAFLQQQRQAQAQVGDSAQKIPDNQLDSLVAPIAVYPDPLLSQSLVASTYPLEVMQLQQFLNANPLLKDQPLGDAVAQQPWDPSVQALAIFPDAVTRLSGDLTWTTDLGNAFLAQPSDVMASVQRMRARAVQNGTLMTCEQQTVETQTLDNGQQVITIEPANPDEVYVPYYDPTMVYGASAYPYPPIYYPPPGYYQPGKAVAFAVGVILGKAWSGGWGYQPGWGKGEVNLNINNKYIRNSTRSVSGTQAGAFNQTANIAGGAKWQHNPVHRGGTPYSNRQLADKYGSIQGNLGGGNRLDRNVPAVATRDVARPSIGQGGGSPNAGNQGGQFISWSHGDPGAFNGDGRDMTRASSNRGTTSMGGAIRGGGGGGRGGGRRR
jgi:hypothetical protein